MRFCVVLSPCPELPDVAVLQRSDFGEELPEIEDTIRVPEPAERRSENPLKPTVVLVHGAFAELL